MRRYWYGFTVVAVAALIGLLVLSAWPMPVTNADAQTMRIANSLAGTNQTSEAVQLYQQLVDSGVRNVELYYNLGLAHNMLGNTGEALYAFRMAESLAPRDPDIYAQIAAMRAETGPRPPARDLPQRLERAIETFVSPDETALLALGAWLLFALLLFATGALRPGFLRSAVRALSIIAGVFALVGILAFGARVYVNLLEPPAVVVRPASPASEPGAASERPPLNPGAEVAVLARQGNYVQVLLPGSGNVGWMPADAVALLSQLPLGPLGR